jgi:hypothetical protein
MASQEDLTGRGQETRSDLFFPYHRLSLTGLHKKKKRKKKKRKKEKKKKMGVFGFEIGLPKVRMLGALATGRSK